jgi:hypothetical protein
MSREKYLARQARYNRSVKGQKRNRRYENKHPERKGRWAPLERTSRRII